MLKYWLENSFDLISASKLLYTLPRSSSRLAMPLFDEIAGVHGACGYQHGVILCYTFGYWKLYSSLEGHIFTIQFHCYTVGMCMSIPCMTWTHTHAHIHTHMCMSIPCMTWIHTHTHIWYTHACMHVHMYAHTHTHTTSHVVFWAMLNAMMSLSLQVKLQQ